MDHSAGRADTTEGDDFDPRRAAVVLDRAAQQARRTFTPLTPLLFTFRAAALLVVFGGCWLSVRDQHPYSGLHRGWAVAVAIVLVVINIGLTAAVIARAGTGVTGPAQRRWRAWLTVMAVVWVIAYLVTAQRYHAGASHPAWGLYPASEPLLIAGLVAAAAAAALRIWPMAGVGLAIAGVAAAAGFAGPAGSWLIVGIGLSAVMLGAAVATAWARHRSVVRL